MLPLVIAIFLARRYHFTKARTESCLVLATLGWGLFLSGAMAADSKLERRPFLGLAAQALPAELRNKLKLPADQGLLAGRTAD